MGIRVIGRDTALYGFGNALLRFTSFLLIPLYTHTLSITEYGLLTTLLTSIQIMIIFMGLGSQTSFLRFYPEFQSGQNIGQLLTASMIINMTGGLFVMLVCYTLLAPLFVAVSHVPDSTYIILTSVAALFQSLSLHIISLYRARNQPLRFIISSLSGSTFLIILNLLFLIVLKAGIKGALLAQVITYAGLWTVLLFSIFRKTAIRISGSLLCKLLRFGFPLIFSLVGELLTFESPIFVLSYFKGLKEVAIYSVALKIAQISVLALFLPFQMAYEPYVYNNSGKPGLSATITDLLTYIMLIFAILAFGIPVRITLAGTPATIEYGLTGSITTALAPMKT